MSATSPAGPASSRPERHARAHEDEQGRGWLGFAGTMLAIVGTLNVVYGIAAIDEARVYVGEVEFVFGGLKTWGWILVIVGVIQLAAAFGVWNRADWARWAGVVAASANAILQLLFLPAFPFLSLSLLAIDVLVIYGLIQYGGRHRGA
jgi:hypothetical protein